jgi:hypothetical protein
MHADHSGRSVRRLKHWDHGFESHSRHGCLSLLRVCVVLCVGSGLVSGLIPRPSSPTDCLQDSQFLN